MRYLQYVLQILEAGLAAGVVEILGLFSGCVSRTSRGGQPAVNGL